MIHPPTPHTRQPRSGFCHDSRAFFSLIHVNGRADGIRWIRSIDGVIDGAAIIGNRRAAG